MTDQDLEIIEMYLLQKLEPRDKAAFEHRMQTDAEFKTMVSQMSASVKAIRQSVFDDKLSLLREEETKYAPSTASTFQLKPVYKWVAIAAMMLGALFVIRPLLSPDAGIRNPYLAEHFEDYVIHDTHKGNVDNTASQEKMKAYDLYAIGDFDEATPLLTKYWESEHDTLSMFYLWVIGKATDEADLVNRYDQTITQYLQNDTTYSNLVAKLR